MALPIATAGSSSTHGGSPSSFSANVKAASLGVLRLGDTFTCPTHGSQTVSSASTVAKADNLGIARQGDSISCGATITNGIATITVG